MIATAKFFANNTLSNKEKTFVQVVRVCVITEDESFPRASEAQIDVEFLIFQNKIWACAYHELHYCMISSKKPYYLVITNYKSDRIKKLYLNTLCCAEHVSTFSIVIFELPITKIFKHLQKYSKNDNVRFLANLPVIFYHFGNFGKGLGDCWSDIR